MWYKKQNMHIHALKKDAYHAKSVCIYTKDIDSCFEKEKSILHPSWKGQKFCFSIGTDII